MRSVDLPELRQCNDVKECYTEPDDVLFWNEATVNDQEREQGGAGRDFRHVGHRVHAVT